LTGHTAPQLRAGSAWALASLLTAMFFGLLRTIVVARFLEPFEIGVMGIAVLALGFVEAVASSGVDTALIAERGDVGAYLDSAFTIQIARAVLLFVLLWIGAPLLARAFHDAAAAGVIRSVATIVLLRGLSNPAAVYAIRQVNFRRLFWWSLPEVLTAFCLTVAFAFLRRDVWALVIGTVGGQVVAMLASYGVVPHRPRATLRLERIAHLLRFGRFVSGARALMYSSVHVDAAVVGVSMGTQALGLYQFAFRVAELPIVTFTRAVSQVALPALSGLHAHTPRLRRVWRTMLAWVLGVNGAAALGILLLGEAAVRISVGERWIGSVPVMRVLAVAMLLRGVTVLTGQLLDAVGQPARTLRLNALRFAALVILVPALGMRGGLVGVASAVLAANAAAALLALRFAERATAE
jgi:O-antigen/teichoic acid export membrane protein